MSKAYSNLPPQAPTQHNSYPQPSHDSMPQMHPPHTPPSNGYHPAQFGTGNAGQDPVQFYDSLIDQLGHPSQVLCRMSDALFFYLDKNCPQHRNSQVIEPEKIFWHSISLGHEADVSEAVVQNLSALYDPAVIPYSLNSARAPVLDRRGYLHLCVFEIRANPEECHPYWNKILNIFKLLDPLTNLPFPTPIPRTAFPFYPNPDLKRVFVAWQTNAVVHLAHQRTQAQINQISAAYHVPNPAMNMGLSTYALGQLGGQGQTPLATSSYLSQMHLQQSTTSVQSLEVMQKIEEEKKKTAMISAGASIVTSLMGAGGGGGFGFGN
ncbi:hypothetical protein BU17DRAFT_88707 [Hysterangium stoloniferum]|nr:hypothetical protein BU17DRAFT_88707 [Hysterangium stoloniferum]